MQIVEIDGFVGYWTSVRGRTRGVAAHVPAERMEWSPAEGRFTPGDIIRHIAATERWMWAENAWGRPSRYPGHGIELAEGRDEILDLMDRWHAESRELIGALTPEQLQAKCETVGGIEITVWKWLRLMIEHEIHHRGQLYELLGLMGAPAPPLYGLTEPEVAARSLPS